MPMDVAWFLQGRIILMRSYGHITHEESETANEQLKLFFAQKEQAHIHTIVDQTDMLSFPIGLRAMQDSFSMINDPTAGWVLVFGSKNQVADFVTSMLAQIASLKYRKVSNLEDGINFLKLVDPELVHLLDKKQSS